MIVASKKVASDESSVSSLYKERTVADSYIDKRFSFSWQILLHMTQVSEVENIVREILPETVLEIAPGPARLAADLRGVKQGVMLEYSKEMIRVARKRLKEKGLERVWELTHGNAFELSRLACCFDLIYAFRFIRHFRSQERSRLYEGISTCLKQGGLLMFDVVNAPTRAKLDARAVAPPEDALSVYDVTYTESEFRAEMGKHGFVVLSMVPVLKCFGLQSWISWKLDDVVPKLSSRLVQMLEKVPTKNPLEWVALCRKN